MSNRSAAESIGSSEHDLNDAPLYVSKPLLPRLEDVNGYLQKIWASERVTNHGPLSLLLEERLAGLLEVPTALLFNNGTTAMFAALKMFNLPLGSEVITTPMTFAATAHSIAWNNLKPVFADISDKDLTLDPLSVAAAITPRTSAILATHVYGCVCDHPALDVLAKKHDLKLIYDAAHVFGTRWNNQSVATLGDAAVFSFHATKLYNTIEGGLLATTQASDKDKGYFLRNFGIKSEEEVVSIGLNGKINELQAAIGLLNLDLFETERRLRATLRAHYVALLSGIDGVVVQDVGPDVSQSEQYFLVRIESKVLGKHRDQIKDELERQNIFCRKYFFPLCTDYEPYRNFPIISHRNKPYAIVAKDEVLCLPFHSGVTAEHIEKIGATFRPGT